MPHRRSRDISEQILKRLKPWPVVDWSAPAKPEKAPFCANSSCRGCPARGETIFVQPLRG